MQSLVLMVFLLVATANADIITCSFSNQSVIITQPIFTENIEKIYTCNATVAQEASLTLKEVLWTNVSGPFPGKTLEDVQYLTMISQKLSVLPGNIGGFFKNLRGLNANQNPLKTISATDLKGLSKLELFQAANTELTFLPADLFTHTPKLKRLSFEGSKIQHIGQGIVTNLKYLNMLNLFSNICVKNYGNGHEEVLSLALKLVSWCPPMQCAKETDELERKKAQIALLNDKVAHLELENLLLGVTIAQLSQ